MTSDDNGFVPVGNGSRDVIAQNGFAKDRSIQNVSDGHIGTAPHPFEVELAHTRFVRGDCCALDRHPVFPCCLGRFNRYPVVGQVPRLNAEVEVFEIKTQIRKYQGFPNPAPDDAGHFVAVHFHNRHVDPYFAHVDSLSALCAPFRNEQ